MIIMLPSRIVMSRLRISISAFNSVCKGGEIGLGCELRDRLGHRVT
jgi:hypothetical protein